MADTTTQQVNSTVTSSITPLDGLRGIAAVLVVLTHVGFVTGSYGLGGLGAALARFDIGVALFFVLSGFLLTRPWIAAPADSPPSARRYARRRAARILPAYWAALIVVLFTTARGASPADALSNATLTQVYTGRFLDGYTQTWSLCTEVAFYAVLPLIAPLIVRAARRSTRVAVWMLLGLAAVAWLWIAGIDSGVLPLDRGAAIWLPGHLDWFAGGMALAVLESVLRTRGSRLERRWGAVLAEPWSLVVLAGVVFALACSAVAGPLTLTAPTAAQGVTKEVLYAVVAVLLVTAAAFAPMSSSLARGLGSRAGRALGRVSYGVFLWHLLAVDIVRRALGLELFGGGLLVLAPLGLILSYAMAEVSWRIIELPALRRAGAHPR